MQSGEDEQSEASFLSAYVILQYDDRAAMERALEQVGRGPVGDRVRSSAVLRPLQLDRSDAERPQGDHVFFAIEAPDDEALQGTTRSLTADSSIIHPPSTVCGCLLCTGYRIVQNGVNPSYLPPDRHLVFLLLRVDRGVRWPQLSTRSVASAACTDGIVVVELTGSDLEALRADAIELLAAQGVLDGRAFVGAGSDLRQS